MSQKSFCTQVGSKSRSRGSIERNCRRPSRVEAIATGLEAIAALEDPVGTVIAHWKRPNGLQIARVWVPLGVIGIIYESRPNVTADAAGLCLKSGNAAILRGGSEALRCNAAIAACIPFPETSKTEMPNTPPFVPSCA